MEDQGTNISVTINGGGALIVFLFLLLVLLIFQIFTYRQLESITRCLENNALCLERIVILETQKIAKREKKKKKRNKHCNINKDMTNSPLDYKRLKLEASRKSQSRKAKSMLLKMIASVLTPGDAIREVTHEDDDDSDRGMSTPCYANSGFESFDDLIPVPEMSDVPPETPDPQEGYDYLQ